MATQNLVVNGDETVGSVVYTDSTGSHEVDYIYNVDSSGSTLVWEKPILPSAPTGFSASDGLHETIQVTWTNSTSGTTPIYYDIYKDGSIWRSNATSGYSSGSGITIGTEYTFQIKARNEFGTTVGGSNNGTAVQDYSAPTLDSITETSSKVIEFTYTAGAEGYPAYDEIRVHKNGSYSFSLTTGLTSPVSTPVVWSVGTYSVQIRVQGDYDASNTSNALNVTIT